MMKNTFISIQEESGFDIQHLITLATFIICFKDFCVEPRMIRGHSCIETMGWKGRLKLAMMISVKIDKPNHYLYQ